MQSTTPRKAPRRKPRQRRSTNTNHALKLAAVPITGRPPVIVSGERAERPERAAAEAGLVRGKRRGWLIVNALDGADAGMRLLETKRQVGNLADVGLAAQELDLRAHWSAPVSVVAVMFSPRA